MVQREGLGLQIDIDGKPMNPERAADLWITWPNAAMALASQLIAENEALRAAKLEISEATSMEELRSRSTRSPSE